MFAHNLVNVFTEKILKKLEMVKKLVAVVMAVLSVVTASAQSADRWRSVNVELMGASSMVGVNYDSRFRAGSPWGYRVGLSWGYSDNDNFFSGGSSSLRAYLAPVAVNYLLGNKRHSLELGFGASLGLCNVHETYFRELEPSTAGEDSFELYGHSRNTFGYYMFGDIGYRFTADNGFQLRVGMNPSFNFGDAHGLKKELFFPYVSFGFAF